MTITDTSRLAHAGASSGRCPACGQVLQETGHAQPRAGDSLVELDRVEKVYQQGRVSVPALRGITMTIEPDRLVAIVGPSGSGKSTLLNLLGALDSPTGGRILFGGRDVTALSEKKRTRFRAENLGFVFQFFNLLPGLTCAQNVALGGVIAGMRRRAARAKAKSLLELVGLGDQINAAARDLSGGQMQRVAIARALVNEPRLVLADEPTGNLDHENAEDVLRILRERASGGRTIVLVTHNEELAERYADEIVLLQDGRLVDGLEVPGTASAAGVALDSPPIPPDRVEGPEETVNEVALGLGGGVVELDVGPFTDFDELARFQDAVGRVGGLEGVCLERFVARRAVFSLRIGRPAALLAQLGEITGGECGPVEVREVERDRLVLDLAS